MGGSIGVQSDGTSGSTFTFTIPYVVPSNDQITDCINNSTPPPEVKRRDSNAFLRNHLHKVLVVEVNQSQ